MKAKPLEVVNFVIANCAEDIQRDLGDVPLHKVLRVLVKFGVSVIEAWEVLNGAKDDKPVYIN